MVMSILTALIICLGGYTTMFGQGQNQVLVDEVRAVVYHATGSEVITLSDISRPSLGGGRLTLRDKIIEELMILDAQTLGVSITKEDAEDFMAKLQRDRGVSRLEMMRMFEEFGYTFDEGLEALRRRQIIEQIVDFRVRSDKRMVIQKEELLEYIEKNPRYTQAVLVLSQAVAPVPSDSGHVWTPDELETLAWEESFEVGESELSEDKAFVLDAVPGAIVGEELTDEGVELTRLIEKHDRQIVPAEERMDEAAMILGQERFAQAMSDYQKMLLEGALIRFTYEIDQQEILGSVPEKCSE